VVKPGPTRRAFAPLRVGVGAAWREAEYTQVSLPFESAAVWVALLEAVVLILKGLFARTRFFAVTGLEGRR
jgi:hypothetical protein